jgi:hypothetical protein
LLVFALPGTPVYDGNRLFLIVMPMIILFAARAFSQIQSSTTSDDAPGSSMTRSLVRWKIAVLVFLAVQPFGSSVFSPFAISQYGPFAGGNNGAAALGMESSYWSDGLNGSFWKQVPENSTVYVAPVSHQFQLQDIMSLVPIVQQRNIKLVPYQYDPEKQKGLLLLIHRLADLRPELRTVPEGATIIAEVRLDKVILARLIDTSNLERP